VRQENLMRFAFSFGSQLTAVSSVEKCQRIFKSSNWYSFIPCHQLELQNSPEPKHTEEPCGYGASIVPLAERVIKKDCVWTL
jgi:hypothetical protein